MMNNSITKEVISEVMHPDNLKRLERRGELQRRAASRRNQLFRRRELARKKKQS